jgi:hypothetical protein
MQMMPKISWPQRVASDANGRAEMLVAAVIVGLLPFLAGRQFLSVSSWHRFSRFALLPDSVRSASAAWVAKDCFASISNTDSLLRRINATRLTLHRNHQ